MSHLIDQFKRGKIFGHPIHSMLVHFPSALFPAALLFDVLSLFFHNQCLSCAAFYTLLLGLILGLVAACFGALDYARIPAVHPAWNKASLHGLLNTIWLILFGIVFGLKVKTYPHIELATAVQVIISIIGVLGLVLSNYLGAELIFRYRIGLEEIENYSDKKIP